MKVIEDTLARYTSSDNAPVNITDAFVVVAIDKSIHLDYVYFLLRRQPDLMVKFLSSRTATLASVAASSSGPNGRKNGNDLKKRKRKGDSNFRKFPF